MKNHPIFKNTSPLDYLIKKPLTRTIFRNKNKLLTSSIKTSTPGRPQTSKTFIRDKRKKITTCEERVKKGNESRRRNFFRSRAKGGSDRPEKQRRHEKC